MTTRRLVQVLLLGMGLHCACPGWAATDYFWKNAAAGNWSSPANWLWIDWNVGVWNNATSLPTAMNGVYLGNTSPVNKCTVTSGTTAVCDYLYVGQSDADGLDILGTLDLTQPGGSWNLFSWGAWGNTPGGSTVSLYSGGTLNTPIMTGVLDTNPAHEDDFNQEGGTANIGTLRIHPTTGDVGKLVYTLSGGTANIGRITGLGGVSGAASPYLTLNINGGTLVVNAVDFDNCVAGGTIRAGGIPVNSGNRVDLLIVDTTSSPGNAVVTLRPPPQIISQSLANAVLTLTFAGGELESAPTIHGPWTATGNTSGQYSENIGGSAANKFFRVHSQSLPILPAAADNPAPSNGATNVSVHSWLSWIAGGGASSHDVFFGTSNPPGFQGNQTSNTFNPGALSENTTYYWRIDEKNSAGTTTGSLWSFTTGRSVVNIMPLGDSITQGHLTLWETYRYYLWNKLKTGGYTNVNFVGSHQLLAFNVTDPRDFDKDHEGHGGWTTDQILTGGGTEAGGYGNLTLWLNTLQTSGEIPDIVLMHLGTNDSGESDQNVTIGEMKAILDLLRSYNPNVTILLAKIIPYPPNAVNINALNTLIAQQMDGYETATSQVIIVDQNTGFSTSWLADGLHPNATGAAWMSDRWYAALTPILPLP